MGEVAVEGVGDRRNCSIGLEESEKEREKYGFEEWPAGMGVDTPSALANFARRWGGRGDFGGRHVGDKAAVAGERRGDRGVDEVV